MRAAETGAVIDALSTDGGSARFVGGAVRNALLRLEVNDIDIATPLVPDEVIRRLQSSGIKAVPTGIDHGTITAIVGSKFFEVTTLRRDVETDGRHAIVSFSDNWEEDASRRDFTVNAMYASPDGEVFDYFGGLADLAARRIRFIGDPVARIREDYLRILRLFRFHAWYGQGAMDEQGLEAATAERSGLRRLSGERIQKELLRLLAAKNPGPALQAMEKRGILEEIIPGDARLENLKRLVAIDEAESTVPDAVLRLCTLLPKDAAVASAVAERLKLSGANRDRVVDLAGMHEEISSQTTHRALRKLLYVLGVPRVHDLIRLRWSEDADLSHEYGWRELLGATEDWVVPRFPLSGHDVLEAGIQPGPKVGSILSQFEADWLEGDFAEDRPSLLKRLRAAAQSSEH